MSPAEIRALVKPGESSVLEVLASEFVAQIAEAKQMKRDHDSAQDSLIDYLKQKFEQIVVQASHPFDFRDDPNEDDQPSEDDVAASPAPVGGLANPVAAADSAEQTAPVDVVAQETPAESTADPASDSTAPTHAGGVMPGSTVAAPTATPIVHG